MATTHRSRRTTASSPLSPFDPPDDDGNSPSNSPSNSQNSPPVLVPIPRFASPEPDEPEERIEGPRLSGAGIRTGISSPAGGAAERRESAAATTALAVGLIGMIVVVADGLIRRAERDARLRRPSKDQVQALAEPVAALAVRYLPVGLVGPTILDITAAGSAVGSYLLDGPVVERSGAEVRYADPNPNLDPNLGPSTGAGDAPDDWWNRDTDPAVTVTELP